MTKSSLPLIFGAGLLAFTSCAQFGTSTKADGTFASVKPVLERNCVHCHGLEALPTMPSLKDTAALGELVGHDQWIVPGKPELSRFFKVVTLRDDEGGAMPPSGHAIRRNEVETLRQWILAGAPTPKDTQPLSPVGPGQRSR